jgi:hypothetical protein
MILFDLLLLGLILLKAVRVWRAGGRVPLLSVVVRDGVWAFLVILCSFSHIRIYIVRSRTAQAVFFLNNTIQWVLTPPLSSVIWPCVRRALYFLFRSLADAVAVGSTRSAQRRRAARCSRCKQRAERPCKSSCTRRRSTSCLQRSAPSPSVRISCDIGRRAGMKARCMTKAKAENIQTRTAIKAVGGTMC